MYEMAALRPPFQGRSLVELYDNILKGFYKPIPGKYSLELERLIQMMLAISPLDRPSA